MALASPTVPHPKSDFLQSLLHQFSPTLSPSPSSPPRTYFSLSSYSLLLSYCGSSYWGFQLQPPSSSSSYSSADSSSSSSSSSSLPTIESVLFSSLIQLGWIQSGSGNGTSKQLQWTRTARTDKGVHSCINVVASKFFIPVLTTNETHQPRPIPSSSPTPADLSSAISELNRSLPSTIRIVCGVSVGETFHARKCCSGRRYEYWIPSFVFQTRGKEEREREREIGSEMIEEAGGSGERDARDGREGEGDEDGGESEVNANMNAATGAVHVAIDDDSDEGIVCRAEALVRELQPQVDQANQAYQSTSSQPTPPIIPSTSQSTETAAAATAAAGAVDRPHRRVVKRKTLLMYRALVKAIKSGNIAAMRHVLKQHQPEPPPFPPPLTADGSATSPSSSFTSSLLHHIHTQRAQSLAAIRSISNEQCVQFRLTDQVKERMNGILKGFIGIKSYHNLCKLKSRDYSDLSTPSTIRTVTDFYIQSVSLHPYSSSFSSSTSSSSSQMEYCHVIIEGKSFLLNQIRKMIGLAVAIARGVVDEGEVMKKVFEVGMEMNVPTAPASGLMLRMPFFTPSTATPAPAPAPSSPLPSTAPTSSSPVHDRFGGPPDAAGVSELNYQLDSREIQSAADEFLQSQLVPVVCSNDRVEQFRCWMMALHDLNQWRREIPTTTTTSAATAIAAGSLVKPTSGACSTDSFAPPSL